MATKVDLHMVLVVPTLTDTCEPVVYLTALTDPARQRLTRILRSSAGPPLADAPQGVLDFSDPPQTEGRAS